MAAGRRQQAAEHAEGRGLARAVRPEQAEDLAAPTSKEVLATAVKSPNLRTRSRTTITGLSGSSA
jgi:hypothetical protein